MYYLQYESPFYKQAAKIEKLRERDVGADQAVRKGRDIVDHHEPKALLTWSKDIISTLCLSWYQYKKCLAIIVQCHFHQHNRACLWVNNIVYYHASVNFYAKSLKPIFW